MADKRATQKPTGVPNTRLNLFLKLKIEIIVDDNKLDKAVEAILRSARTGQVGDGKIFISDVQEVIRIRTEESGTQAL
jgi:nitrogen regulatory protein P-II 1